MAFFRIYWLRRLIRKHMQPVSIKKAATWEQRLSIWYALFAWNALGLIGYQFYIGNGDPAKSLGLKSEVELAMTPAQHFATKMGIQKATIVRFDGIAKGGEREFYLEESEEPTNATKVDDDDDDDDDESEID